MFFFLVKICVLLGTRPISSGVNFSFFFDFETGVSSGWDWRGNPCTDSRTTGTIAELEVVVSNG